MVSSHCCSVSSVHRSVMSVRCVANSSTAMSSNSNRFWMISFSSRSITPFLLPASAIFRISSSLTSTASAFGSIPKRRNRRFVVAFKRAVNGEKTIQNTSRSPLIRNASFCPRFAARRFGSRIPKTSTT